MPLTYRLATAADATYLSQLIWRAKAYWGYPAAWMNQWQAQLMIEPQYIDLHKVIVLSLDNQVAGFYGLENRTHCAYLAHLWVEPKHIGTGLGKVLLNKACRNAKEQGHSSLELVSDPNAASFYAHHGAIKIGEVISQISDTKRILPKMCLTLNNGP